MMIEIGDEVFIKAPMQYRGIKGVVISKAILREHVELCSVDVGGRVLEILNYQLEKSKIKKNTFTKSDLKSGMVVEFGDGERAVVINNFLIHEDEWDDINEFDDDLRYNAYSGDGDESIDVVYSINAKSGLPLIPKDNFSKVKDEDVVWRRYPKTQEMTQEEIEQKLGYKIKIIS